MWCPSGITPLAREWADLLGGSLCGSSNPHNAFPLGLVWRGVLEESSSVYSPSLEWHWRSLEIVPSPPLNIEKARIVANILGESTMLLECSNGPPSLLLRAFCGHAERFFFALLLPFGYSLHPLPANATASQKIIASNLNPPLNSSALDALRTADGPRKRTVPKPSHALRGKRLLASSTPQPAKRPRKEIVSDFN